MNRKQRSSDVRAESHPLAELLQAFALAGSSAEDTWQFAVGLASLLRAGLTETVVRHLVGQGYLEHGWETTTTGNRRTFDAPAPLCFTERSCFVLTESGNPFARRSSAAALLNGPAAVAPLPCWDSARGRLSFQGALVKEFRRPARAQRTILDAFEEEGWPRRIHNPLGPEGDRSGAERLHDAINAVNRCQREGRLRFRADGSGAGVCWEAGE